jgi:hypothetical protein
LLSFAIVFDIFLTEMRFLTLLVLFSLVLFSSGCKNGATKPSNPFAQNLQTVPPPVTFSSQESYLGQTPGNYIPQTPATTFPPSGTPVPTQPAIVPSNVPVSDATNNTGDRATLFTASTAAEKESGWTPVDVASTMNTAFQAMDAKVNSTSSHEGGIVKTVSGDSESLIVGSSHVITTITDDSLPKPALAEQQLLYSGKYGE